MPYTAKDLVNFLRLCFPESGSSGCKRCPNSANGDFCDDPGEIMRLCADELERLSLERELDSSRNRTRNPEYHVKELERDG